MKKGYWVVAYRSISDESALKAYAALAIPAIDSFRGRVLTRSTSQVQAHEAGLPLRAIVVEFDSYDIALAAHQSEAYQKALQAMAQVRTVTSASLKAGKPAQSGHFSSTVDGHTFTALKVCRLSSQAGQPLAQKRQWAPSIAIGLRTQTAGCLCVT